MEQAGRIYNVWGASNYVKWRFLVQKHYSGLWETMVYISSSDGTPLLPVSIWTGLEHTHPEWLFIYLFFFFALSQVGSH